MYSSFPLRSPPQEILIWPIASYWKYFSTSSTGPGIAPSGAGPTPGTHSLNALLRHEVGVGKRCRRPKGAPRQDHLQSGEGNTAILVVTEPPSPIGGQGGWRAAGGPRAWPCDRPAYPACAPSSGAGPIHTTGVLSLRCVLIHLSTCRSIPAITSISGPEPNGRGYAPYRDTSYYCRAQCVRVYA
eukprot:5695219-Pleurochrysis_carterae.AAC.2